MNLAKLLEDAKFHGIFIADVLGMVLDGMGPSTDFIQEATMSTRTLWSPPSSLDRNGLSMSLL